MIRFVVVVVAEVCGVLMVQKQFNILGIPNLGFPESRHKMFHFKI